MVEESVVEEDFRVDTDEDAVDDAVDDAVLEVTVAEPLLVVVEGITEEDMMIPRPLRYRQMPASGDESDWMRI